MAKHCRVNVIPQDAIDCNQLQSLMGKYVHQSAVHRVFKVQEMVSVLLNVNGSTWLKQDEKVCEHDPVVSVNELARQLRLWQLN